MSTDVQKNRIRGVRFAIAVLVVLLVLSLAVLGVSLVEGGGRSKALDGSGEEPASSVVEDNYIGRDDNAQDGSTGQLPANENKDSQSVAANAADNPVIELYSGHNIDNLNFSVVNMFPGDSVTKAFRVKVSHKDPVKVSFFVVKDAGSPELFDALCFEVALRETGETIYNGSAANLESIPAQCNLSASNQGTDVLTYDVRAYLPTSVGNECMYKQLTVSLRWAADNEGLTPPKTGDLVIGVIAGACLVMLAAIILLVGIRRRKGGDQDE